MRVLLVAIPEPGHLNALIGVAQHLTANGHEIAFFTHDDITPRLVRAQIECPAFFISQKPPPRIAGPRTRALGRILNDPAWRTKWFYYLMFGKLDAQIKRLREVIEEFRPDVISVDPMAYAGVIAAEQLGIPWAAVSPLLSSLAPPGWDCPMFEALRELESVRAQAFAKHGVEATFRAGDAISPWLNVVFTTEAFIPRELSGNLHATHVGPSRPRGRRGDEPDFPWDRLTDAPLIYMAYGAGAQLSFDSQLFTTIAEATQTLGAQVVMSLGDLASEPFARDLPAHVVTVPFAPQRALLARATAMVGHGGANSVMESLDAGRPSLILPLTHEQPLQGRFLEAAGAGFHVAPAELTPVNALDLLGRLLAASSSQRARAAEISESYAARDGAITTSELLVQLAKSRAPIPVT
ncbi:MAG TPA: glycosyltransferase [Kofleriaceae bacterium]